MDYKLIILIGFVGIAIIGSLFLRESTAYSVGMQLDPTLQNNQNTIVIIPILTANAYKDGSFYDYYYKKCDKSCLSVYVDQSIKLDEPSSAMTVKTLKRLGYPTISDLQLYHHLRINPSHLESYDKVIVLHSEYVPIEVYDALNAHPNVIYLNPNANYALVSIEKFTMTLVRGHGYPEESIGNGFGWEYENTIQEYDKECKEWEFKPIPNGYQLNCNPELVIYRNFELLRALNNL